MAAIYGYRFNDELWRLNDQGNQGLCQYLAQSVGTAARSRGLNLKMVLTTRQITLNWQSTEEKKPSIGQRQMVLGTIG